MRLCEYCNQPAGKSCSELGLSTSYQLPCCEEEDDLQATNPFRMLGIDAEGEAQYGTGDPTADPTGAAAGAGAGRGVKGRKAGRYSRSLFSSI